MLNLIYKQMKDTFTKQWITENSLDVIGGYEDGVLTIRGLHYRLVARGMTNDIQHYKRVVSAMIDSRKEGLIRYEVFSDHDREMIGFTHYEDVSLENKVDQAKQQVKAWMHSYYRNRWEGQPYYPEVFIEKKALQGVFETICRRNDVALGACKGYPSLTFLYDASKRMAEAVAAGHKAVIIYFGDYDPSGEDIPRSILENLLAFGNLQEGDIEVRRIALKEEQVVEWQLPPAPVKVGDSRSAAWTGLGQVELDSVEPHTLQKLCADAIADVFDADIYANVQERETAERSDFQEQLREFVNNL
jgi:hypothetical protein